MNAPAQITVTHRIPIGRPISVNNMFANNRKGGGRRITERYRTWRQAQGWQMKEAGPLPSIKGAVHVAAWIPERKVSPLMDIDNTAKGYLDMLVNLGVIEDDSRKIVRSLCLHWIDADAGWIDVTPLESKCATTRGKA